MKNFKIFSEPRKVYSDMLNEIKNAKNNIYLESYIYDNDKIGKKFLKELTKKAKHGIKVKVLLDGFGSGVKEEFFKKLIEAGGEVKFFKEFRYVIRFLSKNHERNHRKILIIDDRVTYTGSMNITESCLNWRELVLKFEGPLTERFIESFNYSWDSAELISRKKIKIRLHEGFEVLHDLPHNPKRLTQSKYEGMIKQAKKEILIETPYFVPPLRIRRALAKAVARGVEVKILLPFISDVHFVDIIRNRYLGSLYNAGVKIYFYMPKVLHSKLLLVDDKFFLLGSSNLDYRSFLHHFEINLFGKNKELIAELKNFYNSGLKQSKLFSYIEWKKRSSLKKILELLAAAIERYL